MKNLLRILRFVWPYRRRFLLSIFFAFMVASLWSLVILLTLPVMELMLNDRTPSEFIDAKIAEVEAELEQLDTHLNNLREQLESQTPDESSVLRKTARGSQKQGFASLKLFLLRAVRTHVLRAIPDDRFQAITIVFAIVVVAAIMRGICRFVQETLVGSVMQLSVIGLRKHVFRQTLKLDYQTIALDGTPELMSRFTFDIQVLGEALRVMGIKLVREPMKAAGCVICAFFINWQLTLLSLVCVPPALLLFSRIGRLLKRASQRMLESMSRIYKVLEETFESIKVVIAFDGAHRQRVRFHRRNKEFYRTAMRIVRLDAMSSPLTEVLGIISIFLVVLPGAYLICNQTRKVMGITLAGSVMSFEDLATIYALLIGAIDPMRKLSTVYPVLKRCSAAADRVFGLIDRQPLISATPTRTHFPRLRNSIEFSGVTFQYATRDSSEQRLPALDNVTLRVQAGEFIALVGENGSGKSTLVNLLPRFFDPSRGALLIDGVDIRDVPVRELRRQMAIVTQETLLFDDSLLENIRYGRPQATDADVLEAAQRADVLQLIEALPERFATRVGEKGAALSGGQRQRVALARAVIRDPSVLILDEATSAIDAQSEVLIHRVLKEYAQGRTTFVVTHLISPALLEMVTRIAVMDRGQLIAIGTHEDLIRTCPIYERLYQARSGEVAA